MLGKLEEIHNKLKPITINTRGKLMYAPLLVDLQQSPPKEHIPSEHLIILHMATQVITVL